MKGGLIYILPLTTGWITAVVFPVQGALTKWSITWSRRAEVRVILTSRWLTLKRIKSDIKLKELISWLEFWSKYNTKHCEFTLGSIKIKTPVVKKSCEARTFRARKNYSTQIFTALQTNQSCNVRVWCDQETMSFWFLNDWLNSTRVKLIVGMSRNKPLSSQSH